MCKFKVILVDTKRLFGIEIEHSQLNMTYAAAEIIKRVLPFWFKPHREVKLALIEQLAAVNIALYA